jgi:hypothetical protein
VSKTSLRQLICQVPSPPGSRPGRRGRWRRSRRRRREAGVVQLLPKLVAVGPLEQLGDRLQADEAAPEGQRRPPVEPGRGPDATPAAPVLLPVGRQRVAQQQRLGAGIDQPVAGGLGQHPQVAELVGGGAHAGAEGERDPHGPLGVVDDSLDGGADTRLRHQEMGREGVGAHLGQAASAHPALVDVEGIEVVHQAVGQLVGQREPLAARRLAAADEDQGAAADADAEAAIRQHRPLPGAEQIEDRDIERLGQLGQLERADGPGPRSIRDMAVWSRPTRPASSPCVQRLARRASAIRCPSSCWVTACIGTTGDHPFV